MRDDMPQPIRPTPQHVLDDDEEDIEDARYYENLSALVWVAMLVASFATGSGVTWWAMSGGC